MSYFSKHQAALGTFGVATLLIAGALVSTPAAAASAHPEMLSGAPAAEVGFEQQVAAFLEENPKPTDVARGSSASATSQHATAMADWWASVPWSAVAGQWGCEAGVDEVSLLQDEVTQALSATRSGVMHCGEKLTPEQLTVVATPEPRSDLEAQFGIMSTTCSAIGSPSQHCLTTSGVNFSTTFQYYGSGNITGRVRGGLVGLGNPCAQGSLVAQGPIAIGTYGTVWSAASTINQNSYYSSSFLVGGTALYSRYCAIV